MKKIWIFLVTACVLIPLQSWAQQETITLVADGWCPYNCEPSSDHPGYMVELATAAFAKHGIKIEYSNLPWARAIEDTRAGKYTAIIGAYYSDAPDFIYPQKPQGICRFSFYVRSEDPWNYSDIASLQERTLGAINDYSYNIELDDYILNNKENTKSVQILSGDNALDNNLKKLLMKRINTVIEDRQVMAYYLSPPEYKEVKKSIREAGILPDEKDGNGVIFIAFSPVNQNSNKYAKILSDEMENMRKNGELKLILDKYGIEDFSGELSKE